jgi:hypothetical protein
MANVQIELNLKGLNELMTSPEIQQKLETAADAVVREAEKISGRNYKRGKTAVTSRGWIAIAKARPADKHARNSELQHNHLLKAIGIVGLPTRKG